MDCLSPMPSSHMVTPDSVFLCWCEERGWSARASAAQPGLRYPRHFEELSAYSRIGGAVTCAVICVKHIWN